MKELSATDRAFFTLVNQAVASNPFSKERYDIDLQIVGMEGPIDRLVLLKHVIHTVDQRIQRLLDNGEGDIRKYTADDRDVLQTGMLFDVFHRYIESFDELIQRQIHTGDNPCEVSFAPQAIADMVRKGFTKKEACRAFAECYQLRRAFYFIRDGLVGCSPCMNELQRRLWENVFTHDLRIYDRVLCGRMEDFSTLLLGETGTGKGAAAAAVGRSGFIPFDASKNCFTDSFTRTFLSINLSQFSEALIESELFGHKKGSFTGAVDEHQGIFARCSKLGAIFLDEIGDVAIPIQIKLLQVLQERWFTPVGSHQRKRFEGRVIAATNKSLEALRRDGLFRDDFYYRLCTDQIQIPSLRQRIAEDESELPALVESILMRGVGEELTHMVQPICDIIQKDVGLHYAWPGNVRELEQAIRRILLKGHYHGDVCGGEARDLRAHYIRQLDQGSLTAKDLQSGYCRLLYERLGSYEKVAAQTELDWRTVKKYVNV